MVDGCNLREFRGLNVWYRNDEDRFKIPKKNRFGELTQVVKKLTNDDITINYNLFKIIGFDKKNTLIDKRGIKYTCLCTEGSCNHLLIIHHEQSNIHIAIGSICYTRFDESKKKELSNFKKTICNICFTKSNKPFFKGTCFDCLKLQNQDKQYCLDCCKEIKVNSYRPRCVPCYKKSKNSFLFIED
jgi:hypothetical protein